MSTHKIRTAEFKIEALTLADKKVERSGQRTQVITHSYISLAGGVIAVRRDLKLTGNLRY